MKTMLILVALLGLAPHPTMAAAPVDKVAQEFATGYDLLKQQKYQEARTTFEAGLQHNPANAMAHFYLGDACRGLRAWACAEEHYETSIELDEKSPVIELAKQRLRKAKVWRNLEEAKRTINKLNVTSNQLNQATDNLNIALALGLDDEQEAVHDLLVESHRERRTADHEQLAKAELAEKTKNLPSVKETMLFIGNRINDSFSTPGSWVRRSEMQITPEHKFHYSVEGGPKPNYERMSQDEGYCSGGGDVSFYLKLQFSVPIGALVPVETNLSSNRAADFAVIVKCAIGDCVNLQRTATWNCPYKKGNSGENSATHNIQMSSLSVFMGGDVVLAQRVAEAFKHLFAKANEEYKQKSKGDPF